MLTDLLNIQPFHQSNQPSSEYSTIHQKTPKQLYKD